MIAVFFAGVLTGVYVSSLIWKLTDSRGKKKTETTISTIRVNVEAAQAHKEIALLTERAEKLLGLYSKINLEAEAHNGKGTVEGPVRHGVGG